MSMLLMSSACDAADQAAEKNQRAVPVKPAVVAKTAIAKGRIVHDSEYYILEAQHKEKWLADMEIFADLDLSRKFKSYDQRVQVPAAQNLDEILFKMGCLPPECCLRCAFHPAVIMIRECPGKVLRPSGCSVP